jgi:acetyl esterase/lipase
MTLALRRSLLVVAAALLPGCAGMRIHAAKRDVAITEDLPYRPGSTDPKHQLDLYVPRAPRPAAGFPVVLFVHGGFWRGQDRRYYQALTGIYGNIGVALARRGFVVGVQSYRLSPGVGIREQLSDVTAALRWLEEHAADHGGDASRVALVGYSAGGHLVSLVGLDRAVLASEGLPRSSIKGVVSISGILDVHMMELGQDDRFNEDVTYRLFGHGEEAQALLSPSTYVSADSPPFMALAAEHDYPFVVTAARTVTAKLRSLGVRTELREVAGNDHADMVTSIGTDKDAVSGPVADFLDGVMAR